MNRESRTAEEEFRVPAIVVRVGRIVLLTGLRIFWSRCGIGAYGGRYRKPRRTGMYCRGFLYLWQQTWLVNDAGSNATRPACSLLIISQKKKKGLKWFFVLGSMQMLNELLKGWMTRLGDFYTPPISAAMLLSARSFTVSPKCGATINTNSQPRPWVHSF